MSDDAQSDTQPPRDAESLDDVLLAMDVVDTLRHREQLVLRELDKEGREQDLIERLREIYRAQGIEVPDRILKDGVKALEENRFAYSPPKNSLGVQLAKVYIARDRWLKPLLLATGLVFISTTAWHFGVEAPRKARIEALKVELTETLPQELAAARDAAQELAIEDDADLLAETYYRDGMTAIEREDRKAARLALDALSTLKSDLDVNFQVRVVQREGEYSGLFRIPDNSPSARNYYLIVEAVDAAGRIQTVPVANEENNAVSRVDRWGVRVPKAVFDTVAEDKADDQIIQKNIIGEKVTGRLSPSYTIPTLDGAITRWDD